MDPSRLQAPRAGANPVGGLVTERDPRPLKRALCRSYNFSQNSEHPSVTWPWPWQTAISTTFARRGSALTPPGSQPRSLGACDRSTGKLLLLGVLGSRTAHLEALTQKGGPQPHVLPLPESPRNQEGGVTPRSLRKSGAQAPFWTSQTQSHFK